MTAMTYQRNTSPLGTARARGVAGKLASALVGAAPALAEASKKGLKVLLLATVVAAVTVGLIALKAVIVMSRFNYFHS